MRLYGSEGESLNFFCLDKSLQIRLWFKEYSITCQKIYSFISYVQTNKLWFFLYRDKLFFSTHLS